MKFTYIAAAAMTLVSAVAFTGCEKKEPTLADKVGQAGADVQKAAEKAAADVQKAVEQTAADAAKAADELSK